MMETKQTTQQFTSWINDASPDDLVLIGKALFQRVSTLSVEYRKQFVSNIPQRTYEGLPEFGKQHA